MRPINVLFYIFLSLTIFLLAIHVRKTVYLITPSKKLSENVYSGEVVITAQLISNDSEYVLHFDFYDIKSRIVIKNLNAELFNVDSSGKSILNLEKVSPYSGMNPWEALQFENFTMIPDSMKALNPSNNPYFAYDFTFKANSKNLSDKLLIKMTIDLTENYQEKSIRKELLIIRKSRIEIKPLDAHSDASFLLLFFTGLITVILAFFKIFAIKKKVRVN